MNTNKFIEFDKIISYFNPLTPYGKIYKENIVFNTAMCPIKRKHEAISHSFNIIKSKKILSDKIRYHLKNIPYIDENKKDFSSSDIFQIKKFLNNSKAIFNLLPAKEKRFFKANFEMDKLLDYLSMDSNKDDFYISDLYDDTLKKIRRDIENLDLVLKKEKEDFLSFINKETDLDFSKRDFLLVSYSLKNINNSNLLYVEPYDNSFYMAKPRWPEKVLNLMAEREKLIAFEKEKEAEIIKKISTLINSDLKFIREYIKIIEEIDIAFASALMAMELNLSKPALGTDKIICKNAFFIPIKIELAEMKLPYTKLSFVFDKRLNIVAGSNMGGKTVLLKTIAQLQYLSQCGFFVPAERYSAPLFESIQVNVNDEFTVGLSSFASEIKGIIDILKSIKGPTLIFTDEFARTTNIREAQALFSAIIDEFSKRKEIYFFSATHFHDIDFTQESDFLSMKGFNIEKYNAIKDLKKSDNITDRIKIINKCMDYTLIRNKKQKKFYDAINIARILGLDDNILIKAQKYMEEK